MRMGFRNSPMRLRIAADYAVPLWAWQPVVITSESSSVVLHTVTPQEKHHERRKLKQTQAGLGSLT